MTVRSSCIMDEMRKLHVELLKHEALRGKRRKFSLIMGILDAWSEILKIQKFRRVVSYAGFYCFVTVLSYAYTNNTTRAGYSRGDQFYASYPAGTELLTDTTKLYKAALGNCFEVEDWGPIEFCIMAKHFERQGKSPYAYHALQDIKTEYHVAIINVHRKEKQRKKKRGERREERGESLGRFIWLCEDAHRSNRPNKWKNKVKPRINPYHEKVTVQIPTENV
ncbi:hypothetical protein Cgig2_020561 [Carnegiea gigantea]|uniref:Uncharacterized protein n=1 Tax=Carnegiea gigantea TaxID=171969 RepID=A0A9Q1JRC1_9CARY|nr:hypothetical protein Cgig2_020561 [Carnegiea gigantea]